jgi:hypothetical protein
VTDTSRIEQAIRESAENLASEVLETFRSATIQELIELTQKSQAPKPTRRRGRPPKATAAPAEDAVAEQSAPKRRGRPPKNMAVVQPTVAHPAETPKTKKKRKWQKCTAEGCDTNVYMPSGTKKLCYQHHIEAGGKESPLVLARKKKAAEEKAAAADSKPKLEPKTMRRKNSSAAKKPVPAQD